ncbi:MAG: PQQ-dependent sugar dehydrogenase [Planctomycetota bacterium]
MPRPSPVRPHRPAVPAALTAAGLGVLALVSACGGGGGGGGGGGTFGLDGRVAPSTLTFPLSVPTQGSVELFDEFPGARFSEPVFVTAAPSDASRLFVVEQAGRIRVFPKQANVTAGQVTTFLDLTSRVRSGGELGLLGMAFDPAYASNGRFYVNYTTDSGGLGLRSVIARYQVSADPNVALTSETILFTVAQPYENHNGGMLAFGPDGYLYGSLGDGGDGGDPQNNGQSRTTLLGKIFRVDPSGTALGAYAVPADNPFVGVGGGVRAEIWAYGLRNPWRFSFDRGTGRLWAGDVGQNRYEEIDVIVRGGNYGWRKYEGDAAFTNENLPGPFEAPVHVYDRSQGNVVTGGYVYRGTRVPFLGGQYVYADAGSGRVWALAYDGTQATANVQISSADGIVSFGEDAAGELYACDLYTGRVLGLRSTVPGGGTFPQTLSATGLFSDVPNRVPAPGLVPYDVQMPLWSDDAVKARWVALPGTATVGWSQDGAWSFPVQTVLVKSFDLPLVAGNPASAVPVETRVLLLTPSGWEGYSYRWRDDGTDADLLPAGSTRVLTITDPSAPAGTRSQTWTFPSRTDCLRCHTAAVGRVLGLSTRQLNGDFDYGVVGGRVDNQLRTWSGIGMFSGGIPSPSSLPAHPRMDDGAATVAARARAYLDTNCAPCHRPGGPTPVTIDLRSTVPVGSMGVVGATPQAGGLGLPTPLLVAPGSRNGSVLWLRMQATDGNRMPPLGTVRVHVEGSDLVGDWIDAGP